jgi:hypothetical protein
MHTKQLKIVGLLILAVVISWLVFSFLLPIREPATTFPPSASQFDAAQALETYRQFSAEYPSRPLGSIESRQSSGFLIKRLEGLGYQIDFTHFDAKVAGRTQVGRNIFAFKQGETNEILAIVAHYDTVGNTAQSSTGSDIGIGILIELARIFSIGTPRHSLLLILSDGREWGMLGASDIAQSYPKRERLAAVLTLEGITAGETSGFTLDTEGLIGGSTPPWLRRLAFDAPGGQGLSVTSPSGMGELLDKAIALSTTDQGPFLNAGIPAVNLGANLSELPLRRAGNSLSQNSGEQSQRVGIENYGQAAERIIRALDSLSKIPEESMKFFCVGDSKYLSPGTVSSLLWLSFIPTLAALYFHIRNYHRLLTFKRILRDLFGFVGVVLPFVAIYYLIVLFRLTRLISAYSLYPPDPRFIALSNRAWLLLAILFVMALIVGGICYALFRFAAGKIAQADFYASKIVLLAMLVCIIAAALRYNSYWAVLFLLFPAWIWSLVGIGKGHGGSWANRFWIVAAGIPYYAIAAFYISSLQLGWKALWYNVLSLSTGIFTLEGFLIATATIAVGLRLLAIQSIRA